MNGSNAVTMALARLSDLRRQLRGGRLLKAGDLEAAVAGVLPHASCPLVDQWGRLCRGHLPIDRAEARVVLAAGRAAVLAAMDHGLPLAADRPARREQLGGETRL